MTTWKMVPVDITPGQRGMMQAAARCVCCNCNLPVNVIDVIYGEALAAAPQPPAQGPVTNLTLTAPKEIYLCASDGFPDDDTFPEDYEGILWCEDEIEHGDVRYIRADLAPPPDVNAGLRAALEMIAGVRLCPDYLLGDKDIARLALAHFAAAGGKNE